LTSRTWLFTGAKTAALVEVEESAAKASWHGKNISAANKNTAAILAKRLMFFLFSQTLINPSLMIL
jgi:hypothetical protein